MSSSLGRLTGKLLLISARRLESRGASLFSICQSPGMLPVQPLGNLEENYYITGSCEAHWPKGTFKRAALHAAVTFNMLYKLFAAFLIIGPPRAFSARRLDVGSRFSSKPSSLASDTLQNNGSQNDGNKTQFVWILQDLYAGNTFFECVALKLECEQH